MSLVFNTRRKLLIVDKKLMIALEHRFHLHYALVPLSAGGGGAPRALRRLMHWKLECLALGVGNIVHGVCSGRHRSSVALMVEGVWD